MPWIELPAFLARLQPSTHPASYALRLLILTGARSHMVRFARWDEFDMDASIWSLPAERMKMRIAFDIPLAPQVIALLKQIPVVEDSPYLFPGQGKTGVLHANAMRNLLHDLGYEHITRHGFRSTFRDWSGECTHYPREVCEMALAHDERSQTEGAYSRTDFFEKRKALMIDWASFAAGSE